MECKDFRCCLWLSPEASIILETSQVHTIQLENENILILTCEVTALGLITTTVGHSQDTDIHIADQLAASC